MENGKLINIDDILHFIINQKSHCTFILFFLFSFLSLSASLFFPFSLFSPAPHYLLHPITQFSGCNRCFRFISCLYDFDNIQSMTGRICSGNDYIEELNISIIEYAISRLHRQLLHLVYGCFGSVWRVNMQNYLNISFNHMCHTLNIQIKTVQLLHLQLLCRTVKFAALLLFVT